MRATRDFRSFRRYLLAAAATTAAAALPAMAQVVPCLDTLPFRKEVLLENPRDDLKEPVRMDFDMGADGSVDIYLAERGGRVRKYEGATGRLTETGLVPVLLKYEGGLNGIALDPDFKRNRRIFFGGTFTGPTGGVEFQVLRYSLDAAGKLDPGSKSTVLRFPGKEASHAPLVLRFDRDGNLLAAVGDDFVGEAGPANTNDLRGKILRIRPKEDGGYDIPPGNLFPPGTAKTRPEIYVMGARNTYSMTYEGKTGRIAWGDFGPDQKGARTEEHNITAVPGNFGWPYFAGRNFFLLDQAPLDPMAPVNRGIANTGLEILPPAIPAVHSYGQSGSVTGPLYRVPPPGAARPLPPVFDGLWFVTDFPQGWVDTLRLDEAGTTLKAQGRMKNLKFKGPIDFQQGPDGALYVVEYAGNYGPSVDSKVVRLHYQGCAPPVAVRRGEANPRATAWRVRTGRFVLESEGPHRIRVLDLSGRELASKAEAFLPHRRK